MASGYSVGRWLCSELQLLGGGGGGGGGGVVVSPAHPRLDETMAVYCHMSSFHYVCYFSSKSHC